MEKKLGKLSVGFRMKGRDLDIVGVLNTICNIRNDTIRFKIYVNFPFHSNSRHGDCLRRIVIYIISRIALAVSSSLGIHPNTIFVRMRRD